MFDNPHPIIHFTPIVLTNRRLTLLFDNLYSLFLFFRPIVLTNRRLNILLFLSFAFFLSSGFAGGLPESFSDGCKDGESKTVLLLHLQTASLFNFSHQTPHTHSILSYSSVFLTTLFLSLFRACAPFWRAKCRRRRSVWICWRR